MATHGRGQVREVEPQSLGYKLRRLQLSYNRYFSQAAPRATLPMRQLGSLALICRNPGLTPGDLRKLLMLDGAQLSGILKCLEQRALIRRERSDLDSRSCRLHATHLGATEYCRVQNMVRDFEEDFLKDALNEPEQQMLMDLLDRVLARSEALK